MAKSSFYDGDPGTPVDPPTPLSVEPGEGNDEAPSSFYKSGPFVDDLISAAAAATHFVRYDAAQNLDETQQLQARRNIGADHLAISLTETGTVSNNTDDAFAPNYVFVTENTSNPGGSVVGLEVRLTSNGANVDWNRTAFIAEMEVDAANSPSATVSNFTGAFHQSYANVNMRGTAGAGNARGDLFAEYNRVWADVDATFYENITACYNEAVLFGSAGFRFGVTSISFGSQATYDAAIAIGGNDSGFGMGIAFSDQFGPVPLGTNATAIKWNVFSGPYTIACGIDFSSGVTFTDAFIKGPGGFGISKGGDTVTHGGVTFANLPAVPVAGMVSYVTDSTTTTAGAVISGGGAFKVLAFYDGTNWVNASGTGSGGVSDGDKGDITVSGGGVVWTIDNDVVTYAKMQNISATSRVLGRITAGAGDPEELTGANVKTIIGSGDLTKVDDTNVTLTLGGTPTGALYSSTSLTLGWTGTLAPTRGGTGTGTYTLGDILYSDASNSLAKLAGNITTTRKFLRQTGNGSISAAPAWDTILAADVPGSALTKTDDTNVTLTLGGTPSTALLAATSLTLGWTGTLAVGRGGIGVGTITGLMQGNGTSPVTGITNSSTTGQVLRVTGASTYAWGALDLANSSAITGDLPFANLAQGSARSVLGVTGNATADVASIQGTADQTLVVNSAGTALAFGALNLSAAAAITGDLPFANLTQGTARSVLGVTGNATADFASIQGTADQVLVVNTAGTALAFGTVATGGITNNAVTDAKLRQGSARTVIGVTGNATANVADIQGTTDQVLRVNGAGTALAFGAIDLSKSAAATGVLQATSFPALTGDVTTSAGAVATTIANNVVSNAKLAQMAALTLKGNNTASTANAVDLTVPQSVTLLNLDSVYHSLYGGI